MNEQFARSYSALELQPGSSWSEIRDAYQALIKKWHPDHFQQDSKKQRIAEERTMEITRAYKTLADYYRQHGSTPPDLVPVPSPPPARPPETNAPPEYTDQAEDVDNASATDAQARNSTSNPVAAAQWKTFAIVAGIALLLYLWFLDGPPDSNLDTSPLPNSVVQNTPRPEVSEKAIPQPADRFFTLGSMLGEVYTIQGIPSKTEGGVWHYGKSRVYFVNGSVSRWDSHPDNPLRASINVDPVTTGKALIQRGSTKNEVRAIQGTPWHQTEREWVYGSSRIYFSGDVVTGWDESIRNPLKIRK
jgi:hypothetical protein